MEDNITGNSQVSVFSFLDVRLITSRSEAMKRETFVKEYTLLYILSGTGQLFIDGQKVELHRGKAILLLPAMLIKWNQSANQPLRFYSLTFQALRQVAQADQILSFEKVTDGSIFSQHKQLSPACSSELSSLLPHMHTCLMRRSEEQPYKHQTIFHQVLGILLERKETESSIDGNEAISLAKAYMEQHYNQEMSRDTLAGIAGMSPWYFSHKFKELTGFSPTIMLRDIRIRMAKKQLLQQDCSISEVAHRVGYRDDAYFRSIFKEQVGLSPTMFVKRKRDKIAALSYHYAAHLLTLNVVPYATYVEQKRESHRSQFHSSIACHLRRARYLDTNDVEYNLQALVQAKPEVILCDELFDAHEKSMLEKIAPVVEIPWLALEWREHFREISAFVGKRREADQWLSAYERKAQHIRKQLKTSLGSERVALLHVMNGKLLVYGMRNGGSVLYQDLELVPVQNASVIEVCEEIGIDELSFYDSDRLLVVIDEDKLSKKAWMDLQKNEKWSALQAVKRGQVTLVPEIPWLEYSPFTHTMVLDEAVRLFG
ncbi:helix-turn-helix domain-containing protein [uncultured Brevibacillus sp.]|uniref:helix-turn-helix domain-containing protein n=1 Tax=uncultured Brevibacillus sp. TaxID=169970 RepID=UPI002598F3AA|nr:helix-turn-helix domain-containing protein [uncultured Brevibacillus sp.]